jgi:small GTP-binding protein
MRENDNNSDNENKSNEKEKKKKIKKENKKNKHIEKEIFKKIKVILLGESKVGKTCLINCFLNKEFNENTLFTLDYSFVNKIINIENKNYEIHLWDTAGQERYRSISKIYIKGADIVIFVYDITDKKSFSELSFWVKYVEDLIDDDIVKGVAANKMDLFENVDDDKIVNKEEAKEYSNKIGATFQETSAKEDQGGFNSFVEKLVRQFIDKLGKERKSLDTCTLRGAKKGKARKKFC